MKILLLSNLYPPNDLGGYERLAFQVAGALAERGHEIRVLTSGYGGRSERYAGQQVERSLRLIADSEDIYAPFAGQAPEIAAINRHNVAALQTQVTQFAPDVTFAWNLYFLDRSFLEAVFAVAANPVLLLTDNWLVSFLNPAFLQAFFEREVHADTAAGRARPMARIREAVRRFANGPVRLRTRAILPSRFMVDFHRRAGLAFRDATVIPHGVLLSAPGRELTTRERLRCPGQVRLLFAGRVVRLKGVLTAIDALALAVRSLAPARVSLDVVGDQRDTVHCAEVRERVAALGLGDHVRFLPPVAEDALFELFQSYDVYLFPSLYEPFSLTLIHALAAGIPVVASAVGGNVDVVRDGATGLTFPAGDGAALADRIGALVRDPSLRQACASGARRLATQLTFDRMVDAAERYLEWSVREPQAAPRGLAGAR